MRKILILITTLIATSYFSNSQIITTTGNTFTPDTITCTIGDTVFFNLGATHNAVEVDYATYIANGSTSNGGFNIGFGATDMVIPTLAQTYYYVCQPHVGSAMKGVIISYCASHPSPDFTAQAATIIEEVQLSGDNNSITNNTAGINDFYEDYTASMYTEITEGQTYTINITLGDLSGTESYLGGAKVFIDYNIDGDFNDAGEDIGIIPVQASAGILVPLSFTVPTTGASGPTRMRVVCQSIYDFTTPDDIGPCESPASGSNGSPWFGATEDYTLMISSSTTSCNITNSFFTINATCSSTADGEIYATANNGAPPYSYSWNNGSSTQNLTAVVSGSYSVIITDSLGCSLIDSVTLGFDTIKYISQTISTFIDTANPNYPGIVNGYGNWAYDTLSIINNGCDVNIRPEFIISHSSQAIQQGQLELRYFHPIFGPMIIPYDIDTTNGNAYGFWNASAGDSTGFNVTMFSTNQMLMRVKFLNSAPLGLYTAIWNTKEVDSIGNIIQTLTPDDTTLLRLVICNNFSANISSSDITCFGEDDGNAVINSNNGSGNYTYSWSNGLTSDSISNLSPGNYFCNITDANWGCTDSVNVSITEPATLTVNTSSTPEGCGALANGTATVIVSGGTQPYYYYWAPMGATTPSITGLTAGTYAVTITDANGCLVYSGPITVPSTPVLDLTYTANVFPIWPGYNISCFGATDGSISTAINSGSLPITYIWEDATNAGVSLSTDSVISSLAAGVYTLTASDFYGCTFSTPGIILTEPDLVTTGLVLTNPTCVGDNDGQASVSPGSVDIVDWYVLWNAIYQYHDTIVSLGVGTHTVEIINTTTGCSSGIETFTITDPAELSSSYTQTNVSCNGANDGSATVTFFGGTIGGVIGDTNYILGWAGTPFPVYLPYPQNVFNTTLLPPPYNAIPPGVYPYTVTDLNGCIIYDTITITEPDSLTVSLTADTICCPGGNNGTATAIANEGTGPYSYFWSPSGSTTSTGTGLSAGLQNILVTDANNCTIQDSIIVYEYAVISNSFTATNPLCFGDSNGCIYTNITGGDGNYTYLWAAGNQTTPDICNLSAGTYYCTVTDGCGCTFIDSYTLTEPNEFNLNIDSLTDITIYAGNDGSIYISSTGGSGLLSTSWTSNNGFSSNNEDITNLEADFYYLELQDSNLCMYLDTIEITQPSSLWMILDNIGAISCFDSCDGSINIIVNGGDSVYTFNWTGPNGFTSADEDITSLCAGEYILMINDSSAMLIDTFNIYQPQPLSNILTSDTITCYGGQATVDILVYGGSSPFQYNWSNGATNYYTNLGADTHTVEVTDINGCSLFETITLINPDSISLQATATDVSCNGFQDAIVDLTITNGGNIPYLYSANNGITNQTSNVFFNIGAGSYTYLITDVNGCSSEVQLTINQPDSFFSSISTTNTSCYGGCDGIAIVAIIGGTPPYAQDWGGATSSALCADYYNVTITDYNGCLIADGAIITEPNPIIINIWQNGNDLEATNGLISYQWYDVTGNAIVGATSAVYTPSIQGEYYVEVADSNGCSTNSYSVLFLINSVIENTLSVNIYPNPTNGKLIIQCSEDFNTILVFNTVGNTVYKFKNKDSNNKQTIIDLSSFSKGIYFVKIETNNQLINHRIILQ